MNKINFDHLLTFAKIIELGTYSAAAEHLGLTQPAISIQMRQLEKILNVSLFERVGKRTIPTAAGKELLKHVKQLDAKVSNMLSHMSAYSTASSN